MELRIYHFVIWIWGFNSFVVCSEDYYTSLVGLQRLAKVEQEIISALNEYTDSLVERLALVNRYLDDYKESILLSEPDYKGKEVKVYKDEEEVQGLVERVSSHPLKTYRLVKRVSRNLPNFEKTLRDDHDKKFLRLMEKIRKGSILPKNKDVEGAAEGILRIQDAYNVDISEFSEGNFLGHETNSGLNGDDCYYLGVYCLRAEIHTRAVQWLERAYELVLKGDSTITPQEVVKKLKEGIHSHNKALKYGTSKYVFLEPVTYSSNLTVNELNSKHRVRALDSFNPQLYMKDNSLYDLTNFAALCRGEILQPPSTLKDLNCWYERTNPAFFIDPLKLEIHHREPRVVQVYDVVGDTVIDRILGQASPFMIRSMVQGDKASNPIQTSSERTSTTAWINEQTDPILAKIIPRMEAITGLNLKLPGASETLQITSYGIGGHYNPHYDSLQMYNRADTGNSDGLGDRMATFMLYLSEVERGGLTAFPRLGIASRPVKGSAIFWFNSKENGEPDPWSLHGGCPILFGNKWVANKWIRANSQMFTRKCSLNPDK